MRIYAKTEKQKKVLFCSKDVTLTYCTIWLRNSYFHLINPLSNTHAEGAFPNNGTPALQKTSIDILERQMSEFPPFFYPLPNAVSVSVLGFMATEIELIIFSFFSDLQSSIFDYSLEISSNGYSWKLWSIRWIAQIEKTNLTYTI